MEGKIVIVSIDKHQNTSISHRIGSAINVRVRPFQLLRATNNTKNFIDRFGGKNTINKWKKIYNKHFYRHFSFWLIFVGFVLCQLIAFVVSQTFRSFFPSVSFFICSFFFNSVFCVFLTFWVSFVQFGVIVTLNLSLLWKEFQFLWTNTHRRRAYERISDEMKRIRMKSRTK